MVLYPNKLPESERVCSGICNQIKADAQVIINEEMRRIKNDPELRKRLGLEDEKGKDPDKS